MNTYTYADIPDKITVPVSEWKQTVEANVAKYGVVMWINPRYVGDNPDFPVKRGQQQRASNEESGAEPKRRKREIPYVWYVDYKCHRYGKYRDMVAEGLQVKGGASGKVRNLQKASKKSDCKAKLKVTCFKHNTSVVEITHTGVHNHVLGGADDLKHLPLSQDRKNQIMERLREGYNRRDVRVAIQNDFRRFQREYLDVSNEGSQIFHRDQAIHQDEVYNLYRKVEESFYKKSVDEQESVSLWLDELKQQGYSVFKHSTYNTDFTFGFSSPWQKHILLNATMVCLDATHCVSHIERGILYTIVLRQPVTGTGCPVAYMFTKDHSMAAVAVFLAFIRDDVGLASLQKITIDVSATEHAAITAIYPQVNVQWCLFHVSRAWMGKIKELVKLGSTDENNRVHRDIITELKHLQWTKDQDIFCLKLLSFTLKYSMYDDFIKYMERAYLNREKYVHWSAAFQPQIYSNMETNNYIESWHNQLKTTYLNRKRNRRVDRLVYVLVKDVEPDYTSNVARISLNIGRVGPEERRRRRGELDAESINEAILVTLIREPENETDTFKVQSFTSESIFYEIEVSENQMKTCSCEDFKFHRIACKHMYHLLRRLHSNLSVYKGELLKSKGNYFSRESYVIIVDIPMPTIYREAQQAATEAQNSNATTTSAPSTISRAKNAISNYIAMLKSVEHNLEGITDEQVDQIEQHSSNFEETFLQVYRNHGTNSNFTTQRR